MARLLAANYQLPVYWVEFFIPRLLRCILYNLRLLAGVLYRAPIGCQFCLARLSAGILLGANSVLRVYWPELYIARPLAGVLYRLSMGWWHGPLYFAQRVFIHSLQAPVGLL